MRYLAQAAEDTTRAPYVSLRQIWDPDFQTIVSVETGGAFVSGNVSEAYDAIFESICSALICSTSLRIWTSLLSNTPVSIGVYIYIYIYIYMCVCVSVLDKFLVHCGMKWFFSCEEKSLERTTHARERAFVPWTEDDISRLEHIFRILTILYPTHPPNPFLLCDNPW